MKTVIKKISRKIISVKLGSVEQPIAMDTVFMGMDKDGNDMYYNKVTGKTITVPHT